MLWYRYEVLLIAECIGYPIKGAHMKSLQDTFAPNNQCFGCGPDNPQGLQIKSMVEGESLVALFKPKSHHQAFDNVLSGGICGTLLDCHSNWCAAYFIMKLRQEGSPPCTVTAHYTVSLLAPTPMDKVLKIIARPKTVSERKAEISAELIAGEVCTAKCEGLFVAVSPGHPAYHRW
jgi:acyl-coenzyme A thioesterase PaaI-like protein